MQGTAIIIGNMIGGTTAGGGGVIAPTFFIIGDGTIDGDNIIDESGNFLVSQLAPVVFTGLLDTSYGSGAEAAYSVRKLRTAYTGAAMQVQATSGGATAEIGFTVDNNLDTATLLAFAGTNEVRVSIWYDQSLNNNNAVQSSVSVRPIVVDASGALVEQGGKPAVQFDGTNDFLDSVGLSETTLTSFHVAKPDQTNSGDALLCFDGNTGNGFFRYNSNGTMRVNFFGGLNTSTNYTAAQNLVFALYGTSVAIGYDGATAETGSATGITTTGVRIGQKGNVDYFNGNAQEIVLYPSDKTTDRTSIEENIGDYFTQNTPLLDTYSGAAAAYSLRLLDSTYTGFAIKVQDTVGGATQDIGFNVFGELDTVSLSAYGGVNDVFVETWYDQSGSGNNAVQATSSARPKIYDGTTGAVIVENGKPAVEFDGSATYFPLSYSGLDIGAITVNTVCRSNNNSGSRMQFTLGTDINVRFWHYHQSGLERFYYGGSSPFVTYGSADTNQHLFSFIAGSTSGAARMFRDSTEASTSLTLSSGAMNTAQMRLGAYHNNGLIWSGTMQEFIVYSADQTDNRTGIETNINDFYDVYTVAPTPLLLNLYPGASAGYSLRNIDSSYTGPAILVQDNVGGATKAIDFDINGNLNTAELIAYGGGNDVFVATWYDQSGNGNNVTQASLVVRPKIYDGTTGTVILDNGKPAVDFDGVNDALNSTSNVSMPLNNTIAIVAQGTSTTTDEVFNINGAAGVNIRIQSASYKLLYSDLDQSLITSATNNQFLIFAGRQSSSDTVHASIDGGAQLADTSYPSSSWNTATAKIHVGARNGTSLQWDGKVQEVIYYESDELTNRTGIETNINDFYSIY